MKTLQDTLISLIHDAAKQAGYKVKPDQIILETPKDKSHGDFSTTLALRLATQQKKPPLKIANEISTHIQRNLKNHPRLQNKFEKVNVKGGFINLFLSKSALYDCLRQIQKENEKYADSKIGKGIKVLIEFVSANPTGPLSVAHGRQAAVGDSLANILQATGFKVSREYFVNDEGRQIHLLGESIWVRYREILGKEENFPEEGYKGEYIYDIAKSIIERYKDKFLKKDFSKTKDFFVCYGCEYILKSIKNDLEEFGVSFDIWTSQKALRRSGKIEKVLKLLKKKEFLYSKEGALWFKSMHFGDDKDRVVIKSDSSFTYLAPDIAYHQDKFRRGFKILIDIWGPDHHGYIERVKAAIEALGYSKEQAFFLIVQLATLYEGRKVIPMSTRAGEFITLKQVTKEVGKDASRFFFLMRRLSSHLDFDLELAKKKSLENPVYYIQYAHARICSVLELAKQKKSLKPQARLELLNQPEELKMIKTLKLFPQVLASCANTKDPHGLIVYLQDLASNFHSFYDKHRVITQQTPLSAARLVLVDSVRITLAKGLRLLGISAPKKM